MEWVETTGKTIEEAKEAALDQLGVDAEEAEFEVVEEPRSGLFGRTRGVGRVRARVLPRSPRPKPERRRRGKGAGGRDDAGGGADGGRSSSGARKVSDGNGRSGGRSGDNRSGGGRSGDGRSGDGRSGDSRSGGGRPDGARGDRPATESRAADAPAKEREVMDPSEQRQAVEEFVAGLAEAFGSPCTVTSEIDDEGILRVAVDGSEVGLLIGPRLATLDALQEICRNVLQRHADGREHAKVVVDVAGVRELRRSKLAAFVTEAAATVKDDGEEVVFEVMSSADRKVVHDTVAEIDGVASGSVGEDPRRRVVLRPA